MAEIKFPNEQAVKTLLDRAITVRAALHTDRSPISDEAGKVVDLLREMILDHRKALHAIGEQIGIERRWT